MVTRGPLNQNIFLMMRLHKNKMYIYIYRLDKINYEVFIKELKSNLKLRPYDEKFYVHEHVSSSIKIIKR